MDIFRSLRRFSFHLAIYLFIVALIAAGSVLLKVYGPPRYIYSDDSWKDSTPYVPQTDVKYDLLLDQHSHTKYSDGKLTVRQNIEWHLALGFKVVVISDHNTLKNSEEIQLLANEYANRCIVIQGMEWTTNRVHLNFIGIKNWTLEIPWNPTNDEIRQAIDEVHRQNGTVTFNHPGYTRRTSEENVPSNELLYSWGVDYFEVMNGLDFDEGSYNFVKSHNNTVGMISGTDMHSPAKQDGGRVFAWTAINITDFSKEAVMNTLRNYSTEIVINQFGIENQGKYEYNKLYDYLAPFYQIGDAIVYYHLSSDQYGGYADRVILYVFLSYSALFFVVLEAVLAFRRSLRNK